MFESKSGRFFFMFFRVSIEESVMSLKKINYQIRLCHGFWLLWSAFQMVCFFITGFS